MTSNFKVALMAGSVVVGMTGLGFAAVPLYDLFCRVTGFGGTTQVGAQAPGGVSERVTVAFDSNVNVGLPWQFAPEKRSQNVHIGERQMAFYTAKNDSTLPVSGTATFNVTPQRAGKYFTKIECFCFTQQTLQPGQQVRMPVIYYVDPAILDDPEARDIQHITLSYTFYPMDSAKPAG
jgi:cytochrome c oxidase assembly protein subunit 11